MDEPDEDEVPPGMRVRLVWADKRTPTRSTYTRIGPWPGRTHSTANLAVRRNAVAAGSPSHKHAAEVWEAARTAASRSAVGVPIQMADLAMVSELAGHLSQCARCHRTGPLDTATPLEWLTWSIRVRPRLWRVFAPVLVELSGPAVDELAPGGGNPRKRKRPRKVQ